MFHGIPTANTSLLAWKEANIFGFKLTLSILLFKIICGGSANISQQSLLHSTKKLFIQLC